MTEIEQSVDVREAPQRQVHELADAFESECVDLICRQEATLSELSEKNRSSPNVESLELAQQMLLQFLDFAESHFGEEEFREIAQRLHDVYRRTKDQQQQQRNQSWKAIRRMLGRECPSESELSQTYQQLGRDYADLYTDFFHVCMSRFSEDSATKEQFQQSVELLVGELERKW